MKIIIYLYRKRFDKVFIKEAEVISKETNRA